MRRRMFTVVLGFICLVSVSAMAADWAGTLTVGRMYTTETAGGSPLLAVGVSPVPANTCNYYSSIQFVFDPTTDKGKAMYAMLLEAKALGKSIDVWYTDSTAPGTNETNGCNNATMAVLTDVGMSN